jgi:hypothetical protein
VVRVNLASSAASHTEDLHLLPEIPLIVMKKKMTLTWNREGIVREGD